MIKIITIDGPSGSGKGTVASLLAQKLDWHLLDSGAMYRAVAVAVLRQGLNLLSANLSQLIASLNIVLHNNQVWLDNEDISNIIRSEDVGLMASKIAAIPEVRTVLIAQQRACAKPPGLVADGRDMGTLIFPNAQVKIFLTATPEERAQRRYKQLKEKGLHVNLSDLTAAILERDERDQSRSVAPLKAAAAALVVDSTGRSIEIVFTQILAQVVATFPDLQV